MTAALAARFPAWDGIRFVAFDVDGTLYDQRRLRIRIARDMLLDAALRRSLDAVAVVRTYRRLREELGEREVAEFDRVLVARTAEACGCRPERVDAIVEEWIGRRPLAYLGRCRFPGLVELFDGLRHHGKIIGILSDYPAAAKLDALGLSADHLVSASDVGLLKPNPRGLEALIAKAGTTARQTVLIGDRADRDGAAARRIGAWSLIKSARPLGDWQTFARFDDAIFRGLLGRPLIDELLPRERATMAEDSSGWTRKRSAAPQR
jgi:putative hydrolase of the HAD superfamily